MPRGAPIGNKYSLGKKRSEEFKKKVGESKKGNKYWLGRKHTAETKKKMSERLKGNRNGNGNFIKDRSLLKVDRQKMYDTKYKYWMLEVKKRDGWICKMKNLECRWKLEAHHIYNWRDFPRLRYVISNGISLCHFHHPRGKMNEDRMIPILQELIIKP